MSVDALKSRAKQLMDQRDALEAEISAISSRLTALGQPGLQGGLLDSEGYPRADIDVHAVRTDRHRLHCLTNDHKALTAQVEALMAQLHAASRQQGASAIANGNGVLTPASDPLQNTAHSAATAPAAARAAPAAVGAPNASATGLATQPLRPFAFVDEVAGGSPAAAAGIQVGDQMVRFGDVAAASAAAASPASPAANGSSSSSSAGSITELLQRVAGVLQASEGRPVAALVLRQGLPLELQLVPQRWAGRGLLGCHLRALQ